MEQVAFFAGAIGALGGAIAVIALRNPFYSVLALVVHLFALAGLFLMLHAEFVAAAQVVVYAGAVMVLYVFVAAYIGGFEEPLWDAIPGQRILAPLLGLALFVELSIAVLGTSLKSLETDGPTIPLGFGSPEAIGKLLLEQFLIPFEAASLLLLIAAVGAVVLAARRPPLAGTGPGVAATEADRVGPPGGNSWDRKARDAAAADLAPEPEGRTESGPEPEIPVAVAPRAAGGREGGP
jgi:NADH-quinone oxidoreductase subunit J